MGGGRTKGGHTDEGGHTDLRAHQRRAQDRGRVHGFEGTPEEGTPEEGTHRLGRTGGGHTQRINMV